LDGTAAQKATFPLSGDKERVFCSAEICITAAQCNARRKELGIEDEYYNVGDYPTYGCFEKNNMAYWGLGGTTAEQGTFPLGREKERIFCVALPSEAPSKSPSTSPSASPFKPSPKAKGKGKGKASKTKKKTSGGIQANPFS